MKKTSSPIFAATATAALLVGATACTPRPTNDPVAYDASTPVDPVTTADSGTKLPVPCAPAPSTVAGACKGKCGKVPVTLDCGETFYDCPVACPISQTCGDKLHECCVDISGRKDLFCKYYPYFNSTFRDAGSTPSRDANTRIPSPAEVGFRYCDFPGFVDCSK